MWITQSTDKTTIILLNLSMFIFLFNIIFCKGMTDYKLYIPTIYILKRPQSLISMKSRHVFFQTCFASSTKTSTKQ